jgi:hypothetical protein
MPVEAVYVTSLEEVAWGLALITLTIVLHGFGSSFAILTTEEWHDEAEQGRLGMDLARIIGLVLMLVLLHLLEVVAGGSFFFWQDCFSTWSLSYYVALLDYTTLGTEFDLPSRWRLLEGMIAICGLITFAWTTSVLIGHIQQVQDRRISRRRLAHLRKGAERPSAGHEPAAK